MEVDNRLWIVSTYNQDPSEIIDCLHSPFLICNQGEESWVPQEYRTGSLFKQTLHSGHNISDYLEYIIENYHNLPESIGMIKGNIFPRHISQSEFLKRRKMEGFVPLYSDENTFLPQYHRLRRTQLVAQQIAPGYYLEVANNWYCKQRPTGQKFPKLEDMFKRFFKRPPPKYIPFVPGACMIVPSYKIKRWSVDIYKELYEAVTYELFPVEAFHMERSMLYFFDFPE